MCEPVESNTEAHKKYLAKILAGVGRHSRGYQIARWYPLFGNEFSEYGWPLHLLSSLDRFSASDWLTYQQAADLLIARVPWCAERANDFGGQRNNKPEHWFTEMFCRCPAEILIHYLGLSRVVMLWQMSFIASDVSDLTNENTVPNILGFLDKIRLSYVHSTYHSGGHENEPGRMAEFYERQRGILEGMRRFSFGIPGMTAYADYAYTHRWGPCVVSRQHYIDAHLAINIAMGDKHVFTIAFTPTEHGIAICQVQVKEPTGNRWLFSLKEHFLDYALERMHEAFPGEPLLLVSGQSAMTFIEGLYGEKAKPEAEVLSRVSDLYSRKLARFERAAEAIKMTFIGQREFHPLVRKPGFSMTVTAAAMAPPVTAESTLNAVLVGLGHCRAGACQLGR